MRTAPKLAPRLSVVASLGGSLDLETSRLLSCAQACPKAQWILVDSGEGLAQALAMSPALKALKPEALAGPKDASDWGRFVAALALLQGKECLLLPRGIAPSAALFKQLTFALSSAEIVFSRRPAPPRWPLILQNRIWQLPGLDFGSPVLLRRERWISLSQGKDPSSRFLGPRLARQALGSDAQVKLCEAPELPAAKAGLSVLGEAGLAPKIRSALQWIAAGAAVFFLGLIFLKLGRNFFGLSALGLAFFMIFANFGGE
jgi:hypothetical protein